LWRIAVEVRTLPDTLLSFVQLIIIFRNMWGARVLSAKCRYHLKFEGTVSWTKKMGRKENLTWFNPSFKIKYITATELSAANLCHTHMPCKT